MKILELFERAEVDVTDHRWLHGSPHKLNKFQVGEVGEDVYGRGIYLTTSPTRVKTYFNQQSGKGFVHEVDVTCSAPFDFAIPISSQLLQKVNQVCSASVVQKLQEHPHIYGGAEQALLHYVLRTLVGKPVINTLIQHLGYDCLFIPESGDHTLVVFDPNQTKVVEVTPST